MELIEKFIGMEKKSANKLQGLKQLKIFTVGALLCFPLLLRFAEPPLLGWALWIYLTIRHSPKGCVTLPLLGLLTVKIHSLEVVYPQAWPLTSSRKTSAQMMSYQHHLLTHLVC